MGFVGHAPEDSGAHEQHDRNKEDGERRLDTPASGFHTGILWATRHDGEGSHWRPGVVFTVG